MIRSAFLSLAAAALSTPSAAPGRRIVSLVPSLTEMLFAIGAGRRVLAVSSFTTYPAAAAALPVVATFASIDAERIVALHPDLVVGIASQDALVRDVRRAGLNVHLLADDGYEDIFNNILELGRLTGREAAARQLNGDLRARTASLTAAVPKRRKRPRIFVVLQVAPIYTAGNASFLAALIALAGGVNAASALPTAYGRFSDEALLALQPDAIVADELSGFAGVLDRAPWNALRAVRSKHAFILTKVDADVLERPGPRYNEGLKRLIDIVNATPSA